MKQLTTAILFAVICLSCNFSDQLQTSNKIFGDQHFKTAIALVELYNIRYGHYPASLDSLTYIGEWDKIIFNSVAYERLDTGYRLDILQGAVSISPGELKYPEDFWQGLGIRKSNVFGQTQAR